MSKFRLTFVTASEERTMEGKRTKKKLNTKLHSFMDFSPEKEEPSSERKQKHKMALKTIHLNMQENPLDKTELQPTDFDNHEKILQKESKPIFHGKSKLCMKDLPDFQTPTKQTEKVNLGDGLVKKSANKLSLSKRKKLPDGSGWPPVIQSSEKLFKKENELGQPNTIDQLGKRLERLLSASSSESKMKTGKKKIKKAQKVLLEQSVMLSDSDEQMSEDSIISVDLANNKPGPKSIKMSAKQDTSTDDFKFPELPKRAVPGSSQDKLKSDALTKHKKGGKVVKKKLRTVQEIDFSSSSDEEKIITKSVVSDSNQSTKENGNMNSKPTTDISATVDMLTARMDSLLRKPAKKGTKRTKKQIDHPTPAESENSLAKEMDPSASFSNTKCVRNRVSSSEDDRVFISSDSEHSKSVRNISLQVSLNSSKLSELSADNSMNRKSSEESTKESVSSQDGFFQPLNRYGANNDVPVSEIGKEVSLQVSFSQSSSAESDSNVLEPHGQRSEQSSNQEETDSSGIDHTDVSERINEGNEGKTTGDDNSVNGDPDEAKSPHQILSFNGDGKSNETAEISSCSSGTKDTSANSPDESIYTTPPDAKPSLESTAIGDALNFKFSDLNLHVSRISSESSHKSRFSKSPDAGTAKQVVTGESVTSVPSYVPDSDSDESAASSYNGNRGWGKRSSSSSNKTNLSQDVPGSPAMNDSGPTVISDSEDEDFEKFLGAMKQNSKEKENLEFSKCSGSNKSMDDFIVPDSEVESDEDDIMLHRKLDADKSSNSVSWEDAEDGGMDASDDEDNDNDDDDKENDDENSVEVNGDVDEENEESVISISDSSSSENEDDNLFINTPAMNHKTPKPKFTFDDSSDEEDFKDTKEKFYTPQVKLKKDRGIAKDGDGVLFRTPMYVPRKKLVSSVMPNHSPIVPISRGGMTIYPSTEPAKCRTEAKILEKRPQSDGGSEGFLKSLSSDIPLHHRHHDALKFVTSFKANRAELTRKLFTLYNETVFENKMPSNMEVVWNNRLNKTAGRCRSKRDRSAANGRVSKIELSTKVCDSAERVRDTLIHEMCHAAVWLIHGEHGGHGPLWKAFAVKSVRTHPELPPISRCHAYDIAFKFIYKCTNCAYQFGRHSKSLDLERKVCGHCRGRFELLVNSQTSKGQTPRPLRTPSKFALFVKENYGSVKREKQGANHKDIMQILSQKFSQTSLES